jgi:phosphatidylinositol glycan class C protein
LLTHDTESSTTLLYSFVVAVAFVTFLCPAWLVYVQRYKNEIRGPWDYDDTKELDEL